MQVSRRRLIDSPKGLFMMTIHGPAVLDLNTQRDLFSAEGIYPVHQMEKHLDPLKKVFHWVKRQHVPVVSTRLRNLTAPLPRSAGLTPGTPVRERLVGVPGTAGFDKLSNTTLRHRLEFPMDCETSLPVEGFRVHQQYIFDLPSLNLFDSPRLDQLLSESEVGLWIVVGGPLEWTLRTAVLGLLQRRHKVAVVSDALGQWDPYEGDMALRQIESKNIEWLTAGQLVERFEKPKAVERPVARVAARGPVQRALAKAVRATSQAKKRGAAKLKGKREFRAV